jgi:hypothetical protein
MASSVSSERAFSQGGITISKRRNRLKGDIVEALQCVKCAIRHDLLFHEPAPSSALEASLEEDDEALDDNDVESGHEDQAWLDLVTDDDNDTVV